MIWEGMVLGKDCIRKAREKNVDVTVGLTGSCVKKQGGEKNPLRRQNQQNRDVKTEVGMDQQVEKQAESAWGLSEQGDAEYGNAGHTTIQRKIGKGMRMRRIPGELKELAEAK